MGETLRPCKRTRERGESLRLSKLLISIMGEEDDGKESTNSQPRGSRLRNGEIPIEKDSTHQPYRKGAQRKVAKGKGACLQSPSSDKCKRQGRKHLKRVFPEPTTPKKEKERSTLESDKTYFVEVGGENMRNRKVVTGKTDLDLCRNNERSPQKEN